MIANNYMKIKFKRWFATMHAAKSHHNNWQSNRSALVSNYLHRDSALAEISGRYWHLFSKYTTYSILFFFPGSSTCETWYVSRPATGDKPLVLHFPGVRAADLITWYCFLAAFLLNMEKVVGAQLRGAIHGIFQNAVTLLSIRDGGRPHWLRHLVLLHLPSPPALRPHLSLYHKIILLERDIERPMQKYTNLKGVITKLLCIILTIGILIILIVDLLKINSEQFDTTFTCLQHKSS